MTRVQVRVIANNQVELRRAVARLEAAGVAFGSLPNHPGRKGDWLGYGTLDAEPAEGEPTRRSRFRIQEERCQWCGEAGIHTTPTACREARRALTSAQPSG